MNRAALSALILCFCVRAFGQQQQYDLYAGYSATSKIGQGYSLSLSDNFSKHLSAEFEQAGYTGGPASTFTFPGGSLVVLPPNEYLFAAGPRIRSGPLFVHALFGGIEASAFQQTDWGFISEVGGGVDIRLTHNWALRPSLDYQLVRTSLTASQVRGGIGIVYRFGDRVNNNSIARTAPAVQIPRLGISVSSDDQGRIQIVEVNSNSAAEAAFLRPGDLIVSIDGNKVGSPGELSERLANVPSGSQVTVRYMFHAAALGYLPKDVQLAVR